MTAKDYFHKIEAAWSEDRVAAEMDEQILEYIDDDWADEGFDDEWGYYLEYGHGEAEDDIINEMLNEVDVPVRLHGEVTELIKEHFPSLNY